MKVACFLALYMMNRFIKKPSILIGLILGIQLFSATVVVFALIQNVLTIPEIELLVIATGIALPALVVAFDHDPVY
jgi:low affinity Fe/Cu permease